MCHLYPYNNVKLLRKFFYINFIYIRLFPNLAKMEHSHRLYYSTVLEQYLTLITIRNECPLSP